MTEPSDDEELQQPRRRVPPAVLLALAGAGVAGGVVVAVAGREDGTPAPVTSAVTPTPPPTPTATATAVVAPPALLLSAVTAAYPRAKLVEVGVAVPVRADSDRNYQFISGARRITVVVGPVDTRPEVQTTSNRDVLVVAKRSGHRVVVSVRSFRGTLRPTELGVVRRLVRDARLLATS